MLLFAHILIINYDDLQISSFGSTLFEDSHFTSKIYIAPNKNCSLF